MQSQFSSTILSQHHRHQSTSASSLFRDRWSSKVEFLLAVIGYAVDLGNIWRFPSTCYKYGGGAFLIPYLIMFIIGGLPMFYMELVLGQFHRSGCISIWKKICPLFKGIGYGICFICTFIACFYNTIIAHALYFLFYSLQSEVPWKTCNNPWNTPLCAVSLNDSDSSIVLNQSSTLIGKLRTPSEEFFRFNVLEENYSSGFDNLGDIKPSLALCLTVVFILVYFALWKGPRSSGKFVWITATAPYVILSVLFIRGITLPGASIGIYYYLMPNFTVLLDIDVWTAAAVQIFFSLGPGFGVLLALSSYNDYQNNCYRDALVTSIINCGTSFFAGFVIFSTLGYMSTLTNLPVSEIVGDSDANLFSGIEALITGFCDEYPKGGKYVIPFLDEYSISLSVLFIVMCEMIAVCWFYGIRRFSEDIQRMLGFYPGLYWRFCWTCCPIFMAGIFLLTIYKTSLEPMTIGSYTYPQWSAYLGWFLRLTSVLSIPIFAIYYLCIAKGTLKERWQFSIKPQQIASRSWTLRKMASMLPHNTSTITINNNALDTDEATTVINNIIHL
ncbi:Sodium-dependent serotonin transporter [Dirofilaria immitis]|nr:Sodium-dependent serotonin transporter [Dirofilaria immitis]